MADNVDNDVCSYIGKSDSTSTNSLKQIDLTQTNLHHQLKQQHQHHHHAQPLDDDDHINNTNAISADKDDSPCLLATNPSKTLHRNDVQNKKEKRQLIIATILCFFFMFAEIFGGYLCGSLAIMSDAAHLLSDCISFIVALLAIVWAKKSPDNQMTFGYKRVEVLGAIMSIFGIWLLTTFLFYFAVNRVLYQDFDIDADTMMVVSAIGIVINIIMALILHGEGLFCLTNVHHRHNCHSHTPKHDQTYHNNNKTKFEYRPLLNEPMEKHGAKKIWNSIASPTIPRNKSKRTCTATGATTNEMRSKNRSRTNSISRSYAFTNGITNDSDMIRRTSHTLTTLTTLSTNATSSDLQSTDCVDIELHNCDEISPVNCTNEIIGMRDGNGSGGGGTSDTTVIPNGISNEICPIHMYVHRDSSEHTPITSSDSEDLHENHHHHHHQQHHRNGLVNHLHHGQQSRHSHDFSSKNINIQAAVIHVIGDFIQSIGVFISAIIIKNYPNAKIADPLCTFVFSIIVMLTTCSIMKDSIGIILEAVPSSINAQKLKDELRRIDGARSIHSLNVWSLTVGWHVMSVHIVIDPLVEASDVLYIATMIAEKGYNIKQCTIQIEKYRETESTSKTHSIGSETDNSIINILT